jgi:hypothetical protein
VAIVDDWSTPGLILLTNLASCFGRFSGFPVELHAGCDALVFTENTLFFEFTSQQ